VNSGLKGSFRRVFNLLIGWGCGGGGALLYLSGKWKWSYFEFLAVSFRGLSEGFWESEFDLLSISEGNPGGQGVVTLRGF